MIVYKVQCDACQTVYLDADGLEATYLLDTVSVEKGVFIPMDTVAKRTKWEVVGVSIGGQKTADFLLCNECYEKFLSMNNSLFAARPRLKR